MRIDWDIVKEVLEEVESLDPSDAFGLEYSNVVFYKNRQVAVALGMDAEPITDDDIHATEKWQHARQLNEAGMFIAPSINTRPASRGMVRAGGLSLNGVALLDALRKSDVMDMVKKLAGKTTLAIVSEGAKAVFTAAINGNLVN